MDMPARSPQGRREARGSARAGDARVRAPAPVAAPRTRYAAAVNGSALALLILAFVAALGVALWNDVPPETILTWGTGAAALLWLIVLVTLPWNLHFRAREVLAELQRSREAGIRVTDAQLAFAARVRRWTLAVSLGVHLLSAGVALALAVWAAAPLGYPFAGFYLLSCLVRPATAAIQQVRRRLEAIAEDTRFPREDVLKLRGQVEDHEQAVKRLDEALTRLGEEHKALAARAEAQRAELEQKLSALARKFEESLDRLTDNRELISGIKAFLRMIRESSTPG